MSISLFLTLLYSLIVFAISSNKLGFFSIQLPTTIISAPAFEAAFIIFFAKDMILTGSPISRRKISPPLAKADAPSSVSSTFFIGVKTKSSATLGLGKVSTISEVLI